MHIIKEAGLKKGKKIAKKGQKMLKN